MFYLTLGIFAQPYHDAWLVGILALPSDVAPIVCKELPSVWALMTSTLPACRN